MLDKVKPNVLALAVFVTGLTAVLGLQLVFRLLPTEAVAPVFALIVGVGLGNLGSTMSQVAQDPPPPAVPAFIVEKMLDKS